MGTPRFISFHLDECRVLNAFGDGPERRVHTFIHHHLVRGRWLVPANAHPCTFFFNEVEKHVRGDESARIPTRFKFWVLVIITYA